MNTAVLVDSLKYLSYKFNIVSKLSKWIYESLVASQYSEHKIKQVLKDYDSEVVKELIHLVTDRTVLIPYIDDYCSGTNKTFELISIVTSFYCDTFNYKKKEFIMETITKYHYDIPNICDKPLLNKLLDTSILNKTHGLSFILISKGAVLDKLTFQSKIVLETPSQIILLLAKNMDRPHLYQELVQIININKKYHNLVGLILIEIPSLKDQALFELVIKQKIYNTFKLFLRDGFDAASIKLDDNAPSDVVRIVQRYKQIQLRNRELYV